MTEKNEPAAKASKPAVYVAQEDLRMGNGTLAFAAGSEVPAHVLDGDVGKAGDWSSKVKKA